MKKPKSASAVSYTKGQKQAPEVSAAGQRHLATEIAKIARRYGIPVHSDDKLAEALALVEQGEEIPPELFSDVAEVFQKLNLL